MAYLPIPLSFEPSSFSNYYQVFYLGRYLLLPPFLTVVDSGSKYYL